MKRLISVVIILSAVLIFTSCTRKYSDTLEIGQRIAASLGDGVKIYYSLADEVDDEYMSDEICKGLFTNIEYHPANYTIVLTERFDTVLEIGIFLSESRSNALDISELCLMRVREVDVWKDISSDVLIIGNLVIYYMTDSCDDVRTYIESAVDY